jgi:RHS repeat-associated protein
MQGAGGIGGLLARSQDSLPPTPFYMAHSYYHADGNGNVTMLINAGQTVAAKYLYDAFGNTLAQSGYLAAANTYRFSSKEWNANSGLYYYLYRFYDPNLQRWPNRDPIGDHGFAVLSRQGTSHESDVDLYEFVGNSPIGHIDLLGLQLMACTRHVAGFPFVGNHEYLYDSSTGQSCSKRGSSCYQAPPGDPKHDQGPSGDSCVPVGGTPQQQQAAMTCCQAGANSGVWVPGINDCHSIVNRCLSKNGITPPKSPRFGPPTTGYVSTSDPTDSDSSCSSGGD